MVKHRGETASTGDKAHQYCFQLYTLSKSATLAALSLEGMESWVENIRRCIVITPAEVEAAKAVKAAKMAAAAAAAAAAAPKVPSSPQRRMSVRNLMSVPALAAVTVPKAGRS
jgi:hypothetical protein